MFRILSRLTVLVAVVLAASVSLAGENDVLYWMIDENAEFSTGADTKVGLSEFFSSWTSEHDGASSDFAARIRVTGGNITEDTFLDLYVPGYGLDVGSGELGVEFSEVGGYWGAGVPTGNQSPSGDYSAGTPEYCFTVELGNIDSSDNWTTIAWGETKTYTQLANYIHETFDMNPSSMMVWTPTSFAIPEPTSGLLTLLGFAFLTLRRRKLK